MRRVMSINGGLLEIEGVVVLLLVFNLLVSVGIRLELELAIIACYLRLGAIILSTPFSLPSCIMVAMERV